MIYTIGDVDLEFPDTWACNSIFEEMKLDHYRLSDMVFQNGDIVVDIGGHTGEFAIYMGKKYPQINIISFEPIPFLYMDFIKNIENNNVRNVRVFHFAVSGDGRGMTLVGSLNGNTGGASSYMMKSEEGNSLFFTQSLTLDSIFNIFKIDECKFLKIDVEGAEYEILYKTNVLNRVKYFRAEFHENSLIRSMGYNMHELGDYVKGFVEDIFFETCIMHE